MSSLSFDLIFSSTSSYSTLHWSIDAAMELQCLRLASRSLMRLFLTSSSFAHCSSMLLFVYSAESTVRLDQQGLHEGMFLALALLFFLLASCSAWRYHRYSFGLDCIDAALRIPYFNISEQRCDFFHFFLSGSAVFIHDCFGLQLNPVLDSILDQSIYYIHFPNNLLQPAAQVLQLADEIFSLIDQQFVFVCDGLAEHLQLLSVALSIHQLHNLLHGILPKLTFLYHLPIIIILLTRINCIAHSSSILTSFQRISHCLFLFYWGCNKQIMSDQYQRIMEESRQLASRMRNGTGAASLLQAESAPTHHMDALQRFQKDFAAYERMRREEERSRRQSELEQKRIQILQRENKRWELVQNYQQKIKEREQYGSRNQLMGTKRTANTNGLAYNPITLQYDRNPEGQKLKRLDEDAKIRGYVRAHNMDHNGNSKYNPLTGENRIGIEAIVAPQLNTRFQQKKTQHYDNLRLKVPPSSANETRAHSYSRYY